MPEALKKYISINSNILGGTPVIAGTRIPITRLSQLLKQGKSLEEEYPWVDEKKIQYLISYLMDAGLDAYKKTQKIQKI